MKVYKMFMTVCMVIKLSVLSLNAKIAQTTQIADSKVGISKEDAQMLFGTEKANVEVLTQKEMEETKGEFFNIAVLVTGVLVGAGVGLINCAFNGFDDCRDWDFQFPGIVQF